MSAVLEKDVDVLPKWVRNDTQPRPLTIEGMLAERETRYGSFESHASRSQALKAALVVGSPSWATMEAFQRESIEMISHKLARIMNGDPDYVDNWVDIAGYAQLVVDILNERNAQA